MKKGKKAKVLLIAILAVLLVGVLVAVGFITGLIPTGGSADNSTLYWNIDQKQYLSDAGTSSRVQGEDGYYKVRFAVDGEQKEYLVEDKAVVDAIDNMDVMGLVIDRKGVITEVLDPTAVTGGEMVNKWYIISADSEKVVVGDEISGEGLTYNLKISEDTGIYDVTGVEPVGQSTTLKAGDCVRVFKGKVEGISYIFVVEDDRVTFKGETVEKYCEHCEKNVTWNVWTETGMLPTEKGHWMLANAIALEGTQKIETNIEVVVDLNGQKVDGRLNTQMYQVTNDGATLVIMDQSEQKTGTLAAHGWVKTGGIINLSKGFLKIYGGTFDASDVDTDYYGCALRLQSQTTTDIYDGTIIGGISRRVKTGSGSMNGGAGGSIFVDKNAVVNMYDGTIKGGKTYTYQDPVKKSYSYGIGGNIYLATYATFNMYGGEILDGYAERDGGNIYVMGGATFSMENTTISGGVAEQAKGGNLFIGNETKVEIKNSKIINGKAVHGGNIASWSKSSLTMTDCTITDGAATVRGGNIVIIGDLTLNNCTVSGGKAIHEKADDSNGIGGNICALGYSKTENGVKKYEIATVTLKNTTIKGGESSGNGGNITLKEYVNLAIDNSITISDGTSKKGGNIFVARNSIIKMSGGTIKDGTANQGGNIVMWGLSTLELSGGTISNGTAVWRGGNIVCLGDLKMTGGIIKDGKVEHEKPSNDNGIGGNLYFAGYTDTTVKEKPSYKSSLTMTGGTITGGEAVSSRGGNIYIKEMANVIISDKAVIKDGVAKVNGGNIMAQTSSVTITVNKGAVIKDGKAGSNGGNIYNNGAAINLNNVDITGGTSKSGANIFTEGKTGVLTMNGGTLTDGQEAKQGANLYIGQNSTAQINNAKIIDGSVSNRGGNIYASGASKLELTGNTEVSGGKAGDRGGNILSYGDIAIKGNVVIKDGELDNKSAMGGNIYIAEYTQTTKDANGKDVTEVVHESKMTMEGGTITNGKAVNGGNIWAKATLTLKDVLISNGTATAVENDTNARGIGGNILLNGYGMTLSGKTKVINGTAESVTTEIKRTEEDGTVVDELGYRTGCGGNIYSIASITITDEAEVSGGKAIGTEKVKNNNLVLGGNIMIRGEKNNQLTLTIAEGCTVKDGEAYNRGGNINLNQYVDLVVNGTVTNGKITSNNGNGGNIFGQTGSSITIGNRGIVSDGYAAGFGGNIVCNISGKSVTLEEGSQVFGGTAKKGGNIYLTNGNVLMAGGTVKNGTLLDSDDAHGANIYIENGNFSMCGGLLTFDEGFKQTAVNGANIYFENKGKKDVKIHLYADENGNAGEISNGGNADTTNGGNIYVANKSTITIDAGVIKNGTAKSNGGNIAAFGGCIFNMNGGTIESGKATTAGNVHLERYGVGKMTGGEIKDGYASNRGGNLVVWGLAKFTMTGGTITDGEAKNMGGNIFSFGDIEINGGTVTNGKVTAANSKGGNIYTTSFNNTQVTPAETVQTSIVMTGGKVTLGEAVNGGNIWANATVTISGGEVSEGKATAKDDTEATGCGGNIFMNGGSLTVSGEAKVKDGVATSVAEAVSKETTKDEDGKDVTINHGYRTGAGGNIYSAVNVTVKDGAEVTDGTAVAVIANNNCGLGGNIFMYTSSSENRIALIVSGATISGGEAYGRGGNINMYGNGDLTIKGMMDAEGNVVAGENGKDGIVSGGKITASGGNGGNIFGQTSSTITIGNRGIVSGGVTGGKGGNICYNVSGKNITVEAGGQVIGGQAKLGGNIYVVSGNILVDGGIIKEGKTNVTEKDDKGRNVYAKDSNGGNIYSEKANNKITIKNGGSLKDGEAYNGGNIYAKDKAVIALESNALVEGGYASYRGGSMYLTKAELTLTNATIKDGKAANNGGNIVAEGDGTKVTLNNGAVISGGQSGERGGNMTFASTDSVLTINAGSQIINGSAKEAGNVYVFASAKAVVVAGGKITGGTASSKYNNLYLAGDTITFDDTVDANTEIYVDIKDGKTGTVATNAKEAYIAYIKADNSDYEVTFADNKLSFKEK